MKDEIETILRAVDALKKQRTKRPPKTVPSQRDQEIFHRVIVLCHRQIDVAADHKISPSRVSQIVRRVRRWLAEGSTGDPESLPTIGQQRLDRTLARARHEAIYERLLREADRQAAAPKQTTVRTEEKDGAVDKTITTVRDQPLAVQLLKAAQRAAIEIERLADRDPLPQPPPPEPTEREIYWSIYSLLFNWRRRAEQEGRVPRSKGIDGLVRRFLSAFLGVKQEGCGGDSFWPPDAAVRQLVRSFVLLNEPNCGEPPARQQLVAEVNCHEPAAGQSDSEDHPALKCAQLERDNEAQKTVSPATPAAQQHRSPMPLPSADAGADSINQRLEKEFQLSAQVTPTASHHLVLPFLVDS